MKAKVVDLVRTGDKWDFVHAEDQEILTQWNEAGLSFPAIGNLLASAAQQDSQLRELLPASHDHLTKPQEPAESGGEPHSTGLHHNMDQTEIVQPPAVALLPSPLSAHAVENKPRSQLLPHMRTCQVRSVHPLPSMAQQTSAPPMEFDIAIDAPMPCCAAPETSPTRNGEDEVDPSGAFEYFASMEASPECDPLHAWVARLPHAQRRQPAFFPVELGRQHVQQAQAGQCTNRAHRLPTRDLPTPTTLLAKGFHQVYADNGSNLGHYGTAIGPSAYGVRETAGDGVPSKRPRVEDVCDLRGGDSGSELVQPMGRNDHKSDYHVSPKLMPGEVGFDAYRHALDEVLSTPTTQISQLEAAALAEREEQTPHRTVRGLLHDEHIHTRVQDGAASRQFGFTTGNNKALHVSKEALAKAQHILSSADDCQHAGEVQLPPKQQDDATAPAQFGFTTGNNKPLRVSKDALTKARQLLDGMDCGPDAAPQLHVPANDATASTPVGFTSGNNKPLQVSTQALAKAKQVLESVDVHADAASFHTNAASAPVGLGFTTGSNKPLQVSKNALAKAKQLLDSVNNDHESPTAAVLAERDGKATAPAKSGFTTGNNKPLRVSTAALGKAKMLLDGVEGRDNAASDHILASEAITPTPFGFTTGNNKPLQVSTQAMARAKRLLDGTENKESDEGLHAQDALQMLKPAAAAVIEGDRHGGTPVGKPGLNAGRHFVSSTLESDNAATYRMNDGAPLAAQHAKNAQPGGKHIEQFPDVAINAVSNDRTKCVQSTAVCCTPAVRAIGCDDAENVNLGVGNKDTKEIDADTPTLRKQVLRTRATSSSPHVNTDKAPIRTAATAPLSRFAPRSRTSETLQQPTVARVPATSARRKRERNKFVTPRSTGVKPLMTVVAGTPQTAQRPADDNASTKPSSSSTPSTLAVHDLVSSSLRQATAEVFVQVSAPGQTGGGEDTAMKDGCDGEDAGRVGNRLQLRLRELPLDSNAAGSYEFHEANGGIRLAWTDFRARLLVAGVKPQLATEDWVKNHYRWVVWKLARMEFAGWPTTAGRLLVPDLLEDELKRRYEREHGRGHRPWLKAVLQHDESSQTAAVLMVASIELGKHHPKPRVSLELTDGWYWVGATCDETLAALVHRGRIRAGTKVRLIGTQLVSAGPNEPLVAAKDGAHLVLTANGTHPAPPGAKLGRQKHRSTILSLHGVAPVPSAGPVHHTVVVVHRRYPELTWSKLPSGVRTFQTPRAAAGTYRRLEAEIERAEAAAAAEVRAAESKRLANLINRGPHGGVSDLDRWYAAVLANGGDTSELVASLEPSDVARLQQHMHAREEQLAKQARQLAEERLQAETPGTTGAASSETVTLLVGEVCHVSSSAHATLAPNLALITVFRPGYATGGVKEGEVYAVTDLQLAKEERKGGSPLHGTLLHLETTKHTWWRRLAGKMEDLSSMLHAQPFPRCSPSLAGLKQLADAAMAFSRPEDTVKRQASCVFDFVGVVLRVGRRHSISCFHGMYQWIFLADHTLSEEGAKDASNKPDSDASAPYCLLAVRLQGPPESIEWLDGDDEGSVMGFRDLELELAFDGTHRVWRAEGGKHTAVVRRKGRCEGRMAAVAAWAAAHKELVHELQARVQCLLET